MTMNVRRPVHRSVDLCPINLNSIDRNLYLGTLGAATDLKTLWQHKITHILTIEDVPLPEDIRNRKDITTMYIQLVDQPKSDLLSRFEDTYNFIREGVSKGAVLVHCFCGVSRSATVVIAYMMKTYNLTVKEAIDKVREHRSQVYPNSGFMAQLQLYHQMGYKIDSDNREAKKCRLQAAAFEMRRLKSLPERYLDVVKPDPGLTPTEANQVYCFCRKCDRVLASQFNVITHEAKSDLCTKTYFLEPVAWMNVASRMEGVLGCVDCGAHVGGFNWIGGYRCPCDFKMAPAFFLDPHEVKTGTSRSHE